jgi:universal stress protein E
LREQGIDTVTDECSAPTIHAGVVAKVLRSRPSLVIKETHPHSLLRRSLVSNTDWQLIRTCPAPLLFVRPGEWGQKVRIAAAVDICMPGEKPAALDRALLGAAETFALATGAEMYAVHAYVPVSEVTAAATTLAVPMASNATADQIIRENEIRARERFEEALSGHPVKPENRRLLAGAAGDALVAFARSQAIDLMVMGSVSRGWVYNVLVGSTTERLLDFLPCDVLVIRPERFGYDALLPSAEQLPASLQRG